MWTSESDDNQACQSVAEMVAATAQNHIETEIMPGFIYHAEYDMYYNAETGYFFDMKTSLYYHPQTQSYYQYDPSTGEFNVYSAVSTVKWKQKSKRKRAEYLFGQSYVHQMDQVYADVCELVLDVVDRVAFLSGELKSQKMLYEANEEIEFLDEDRSEFDGGSYEFTSSDEEEDEEMERRRLEEEASKLPPCIRLIETSNQSKLHVVTIDGATLGWTQSCDVVLPMCDGVSEHHAKLEFVETGDESYYTVTRLCKKGVTYVNNEEISVKNPFRLAHLDRMSIGPHQMTAHIHNGANTCPDCEPGLLLAKQAQDKARGERASKAERRQSHRQEMRALKAKMGVYHAPTTGTAVRDRAQERRNVHGSEPNLKPKGVYGACKASPVEKPAESKVSVESKGFKLLKSMGWKEGCGLGKRGQGMANPIQTTLKTDRSGLGAAPPTKAAVSQREKERLQILEKTKRRFQDIPEP